MEERIIVPEHLFSFPVFVGIRGNQGFSWGLLCFVTFSSGIRLVPVIEKTIFYLEYVIKQKIFYLGYSAFVLGKI